MKLPTIVSIGLLASLVLLAGCGEKAQSMGGVKKDAAAFTGVGSNPFAQADWKVGDRNSWDEHLKTRAQYGQNDYTRMGQ